MIVRKLGYGLVALSLMGGFVTPVSALTMHKKEDATHKKLKKAKKDIEKDLRKLKSLEKKIENFNRQSQKYMNDKNVDEGLYNEGKIRALTAALNGFDGEPSERAKKS